MSMLLCDFHIHTTWSDGSVDLPEVVDIYGQAGFDVISITDHVYNSDSTIGSWADRLNKTIAVENFPRYIEALEREAERARTRYGMLLIPGVEITKNYLSVEESAHVLLLDLKRYVSADLGWQEIFREARMQGALVIACHPHYTDHEIHDTLYFWNHRQKYASYFDAWEVANRTDLFSVVSLSNLPVLSRRADDTSTHIVNDQVRESVNTLSRAGVWNRIGRRGYGSAATPFSMMCRAYRIIALQHFRPWPDE